MSFRFKANPMTRIAVIAVAAAIFAGFSFPIFAQAQTAGSVTAKIGSGESEFKPLLGFKSVNITARGHQLDDAKGFRGGSTNEFYAGAKHSSGWGIFLQAVEAGSSYGDANKNTMSPSDPSITLIHPTIFDNGWLKQTGSLRRYVPVSNRSVHYGIRQSAYYSVTEMKLSDKWTALNMATVRYFSDASRKDNHTDYFFENRIVASYKFASWYRAGLGNWSQMEHHFGTATGYSSEIFPFADFFLTSHSFISPRVYFPIYSSNVVYDAPTNVSVSNIRAEVFLNLSI
jgi:hypothetical protein